ncbi:tetratricopeptide repeat protein [Saccharospirillum salsuginis]|uniref:PEP-CTERM system TPR-repeat lipoprotein n=1 Tax=Saccharospirillum salsuginis TaxID=418750 RepID=A0A918N7A0_9GAMM|nr:tetratricopeptide repeat protein [Saccharospirillum salsuginis]GGX49738.1 hypothetical protein GCM10007392_16390 [Saccharospirillum salsuginis]
MSTLCRLFIASAACLPLLMTSGCNLQSTESEATEHIQRSETYANQGQYRAAFLEVRNAIQKEAANVKHALALANLYLEVGAGERASDLLKPWQQDYSSDVGLTLAEAYVLQGKHLSARETLTDFAPRNNEERARHLWLQAEIERLAGNTATAIDQYRSLLNDQPDNPEATAGLAKGLIHQGNNLEALEQLEQWRTQNGDRPELLYLQGLIHYRLNELDAAASALSDGLSAMPQSDIFLPIRRQTMGLLSRTLTEQGKLTQAQVYNKILADNTNNDMRQNTEAALEAIGQGDLDTARLTLEDLIQQNPDNDLIAMLLGAVKLQQGELAEGESLLADNIDAETSPVPFIRLATMAQIDKGKRDQALATLERSLLARPTDVDLLAMHGILALTLPNKASEGVVSLNKALQIDDSRTRLRLALAQYYVQHDQVEQALGQLRSAFSQAPGDWPTTNYYVHLLMEQGHKAEAKEVKNTLIETRNDDANAAVLAALTEFRLGETDNAIRRLQDQVTAKPDWVIPHRALATIYQEQQQTDAAINAYLRAAELEPDSFDSLQMAGRLYATQHNPDQVAEWLIQLGDQRPELAVPGAALGAQIRVQQGRFDAARAVLAQYSSNDSDMLDRVNAQLASAEAEQAARAQEWATARAKVAEAISLRPNDLGFNLLLVRIVTAEGEHAEAQQLLDSIENKFGQTAPVMLTQSLVLRQTEGEEAALQYLQEQWRQDPEPELAPEMIRLAHRTGAENTEQLAMEWAERQPQSAGPWVALADIQLSQGKAVMAEASYRKALARDPAHIAAMNNLAWLIRERSPEEALNLSGEAARLAPSSAAVIDTHGWILHLSGQNRQAVEILRRASQLAPDNADIANHLKTVEAAL